MPDGPGGPPGCVAPLRIFSHNKCQTNDATWWWQRWRAEDTTRQDATKLEGYAEMIRQFVSGLTPEQAFEALSPDMLLGHEETVKRFVSQLPLEQRLLAMPEDALRALSDDYLRTLPPEVQDAIRARLGRPGA